MIRSLFLCVLPRHQRRLALCVGRTGRAVGQWRAALLTRSSRPVPANSISIKGQKPAMNGLLANFDQNHDIYADTTDMAIFFD